MLCRSGSDTKKHPWCLEPAPQTPLLCGLRADFWDFFVGAVLPIGVDYPMPNKRAIDAACDWHRWDSSGTQRWHSYMIRFQSSTHVPCHSRPARTCPPCAGQHCKFAEMSAKGPPTGQRSPRTGSSPQVFATPSPRLIPEGEKPDTFTGLALGVQDGRSAYRRNELQKVH